VLEQSRQCVEKFCLQVKNDQEEYIYISEKFGFSQHVPLATLIAFLTNLQKFLQQFSDSFLRLKSRSDENKCNFFQEDPENFPLVMSNAVLTSLPKIFCQKLDSFSLIFRKSSKVV